MTDRFSRRLNLLFTDWERTHGQALTYRELAERLAEYDHRVSMPYLSQLRRGQRTRPAGSLIRALARVFDVDEDYFGAEVCAGTPPNDELVGRIAHRHLRRLLVTASGLTADSLNMLVELASRLRAAEGLPPDSCVRP